MHRSRLSALVIDCKDADPDRAAAFWSAALGRSVKPARPGAALYRELETRDEEPMIFLQSVSHDSRVHLDVEADDLDAEVARLEALGARRVGFVKRWWVMQAPTGQRFCVVSPQRGPLEGKGTAWP